MSRKIDDILKTRYDISPFLVHMTKNYTNGSGEHINAKVTLKNNILRNKELIAGEDSISAASYTTSLANIEDREQYKKFFTAVCFTEAPLPEMHCFFDIRSRTVNYEPYGLVFIKDNLQRKGVSPVFYINNYPDDKSEILNEFCDCITTNPRAAEAMLPLFSSMGKLIKPRNGNRPNENEISFYWEREWRHPYALGNFEIEHNDVFLGLCPHSEITELQNFYFEVMGERILFIDPNRNIKYYSDKIRNEISRRDFDFQNII